MILASIMLAIYLGWPLAFGGERRSLESPAEAHAVKPVPKPRFVPASVVVDADVGAKPESCYKRYQREVRQCVGGSAAACRLGAADHWDMCEATGFWPD
jgi:hypothetical protein